MKINENNYLLKISYDGSNYSGWQVQPKVKTIQNYIEEGIKKIFPNQNIKINGSGRTDAGVHANEQIANVVIDSEMKPEQLRRAINNYLPSDIYIHECNLVNKEFHARFSAKKRQYLYYISSSYSPINRMYSWHCKWDLDKSKLEKCSEIIIGEHDFSLLSKASSDVYNKICIIFESEWIFSNSDICFKITANRFLQHMVRLLVGTMIEIARGRIPVKEFEKMLNNKEINFSSVRAPAEGLFLNKVFYDE